MRRFPILAMFLMGCGGGGAGGTCPVEASATVNGQPCEDAIVYFHPVDEGVTPRAVGRVQSDGKILVTTYKPGDGLLPGRYKITVSWRQKVPGSDRDGPEQLPAKYNDLNPAKSGIKEIEAVAGETVRFELKLQK